MAIKRPPFLTKPYSGYNHREVPEDDKELTRVGPGTPAGEYLRRFWHPVAHVAQLTDVPLALKVMGEELVCFKDKSGRLGLVEAHCPHRGTSLEYGKIEERGIRCCYHSWLMDIDGKILETPGEPENSTLKDRLYHGAYPAMEFRGLVFAYMGPLDKMPEFPKFDLFDVPGHRLEANPISPFATTTADGRITPMHLPCSWLQDVDKFVDPVHEQYLHATISGDQFFDARGEPLQEIKIPGEDEYLESTIGIMTLESRRVRPDSVWVRNIEFIWPNIACLGRQSILLDHAWGPEETEVHDLPRLVWAVPIDDDSHWMLSLVSVPLDETYPALAGGTGRYPSDSNPKTYDEMQRGPGDYEAQIGQRSIAVHDLEHLGTTDRGITLMRKGLRQRVRMLQQGEEPPEMELFSKDIIPTVGGDTLLRVPEAPTPAEDKKLRQKVTRDMAKRYLQNSPNLIVDPK